MARGVELQTAPQAAHQLIKVSLPPSVSAAAQLSTRRRYNHLKFPNFLQTTPLWRGNLPSSPNLSSQRTSAASHFPTLFVPEALKLSFQPEIKPPSIHAAATTRTAVTTCLVTPSAGHDRQTVRRTQAPQA